VEAVAANLCVTARSLTSPWEQLSSFGKMTLLSAFIHSSKDTIFVG
jgi:hypothetical protein